MTDTIVSGILKEKTINFCVAIFGVFILPRGILIHGWSYKSSDCSARSFVSCCLKRNHAAITRLCLDVQHTFNYQAGLVGARPVSLQHLHQTTNQHNLGGGNSNIFYFTPIPGEMIQFDKHIFQMG